MRERERERVRRVEGREGKVSLGEGIHLELAAMVHHLVDHREGERNVWAHCWGVRWRKRRGDEQKEA